MALACDVVLASDRARFGPVFTRRAILPDHAALWFLPRVVGLLAAKEMIFSGRIIEAAEAAQVGLCTRLLSVDGFNTAVHSYCRDLAVGHTRALCAARAIMNKGLESDLWNVQTYERLVQPALFESDDYSEGFDAYREGREPQFKGG